MRGVCILHDVLFEGQKVGNIQREKVGLYYKFYCTCSLLQNNIYRLYAFDGNITVKLGVCIPEGHKFVLRTKIPIKYFLNAPNIFWLEKDTLTDILVSDGKAFSYLDKLDAARLKCSNGQQFIVID